MTQERIELTAKMVRFCEEWMIDCNGAAAYVRAGYSSKGASAGASRLLARPDVQARLSELVTGRAERVGIDADAVVRELWERVRITEENVAKWAEKGLGPPKHSDSIAAAGLLLKHLGAFPPDEHLHRFEPPKTPEEAQAILDATCSATWSAD